MAADSAVEESSAKSESLMHKIKEKLHVHDSSASDSENEKEEKKPLSSPVKSAINRLFGRQKPVHKVFGGGKSADILLWRNKSISAGVLGVATSIWVLFELLEYHFLTLICHGLILSLVFMFLWSNAATLVKKSPPDIPNVFLPDKPVIEVASALTHEVNRAISCFRGIALGRDPKKFILVITGLYFLSIMGSWCNFITWLYIAFVLLHTVPVLYEKYEEQVDNFVEKAMLELKKQYEVFDAKVLSKIPRGQLKNKKL